MDLVRDLRGIVTVLNTPFTKSDRLDEEGLRRNVENAISWEVSGFLVPALAGEAHALSALERQRLVEIVVDQVNGRVAVIGGATAILAEESVEFAGMLNRCGCDGVLAQISAGSEEEFVRRVEGLCASDPGFLMVQDWDPSGPGVPVEWIVRAFGAHARFEAIKVEVMPAGPKYSEILAATGGRLHVSGGWGAMQLIDALDRGVHAFMPTAMHGIYTRIVGLHSEGRRDEAVALFERVLPILAFTNQHLDVSIRFFKGLLQAQGVYATSRVRGPVAPFDAAQSRLADELIERVMAIEASLGKT